MENIDKYEYEKVSDNRWQLIDRLENRKIMQLDSEEKAAEICKYLNSVYRFKVDIKEYKMKLKGDSDA